MINKKEKEYSLENIYKEYVDIWRICNGIVSVFMNLAKENIPSYVLVILVVRNIFIYISFKVN